MLCELRGKSQAHCGLYFAGSQRFGLVEAREGGCLDGKALKDVLHERVHNFDPFAAESHVFVDLLQGAVDVGVEGLLGLAVTRALLCDFSCFRHVL